jgi:hypothetical protein
MTKSVAQSEPHLSPAVEQIAAPSPEPELRTDEWTIEPSVNVAVASLNLKQPSLGKRTARSLRRFVIVFFMGVAATLAWQSHGDELRGLVANSYPQLGWLAPRTAAAETAPEAVPTTPVSTSSDWQEELKAISLNLAAVRQTMDDQLGAMRERVDQLAAQFAATQQQMASDIANLKAADQGILEKIRSPPASRPAAVPARKPAPLPPLSPGQEPSVR